MNQQNNKQSEAEFFNERAGDWNKNIPLENYEVVSDILKKCGIKTKDTVLDVGAGTGILYTILKDKGITEYMAIDISDNMVKEFKKRYPQADVRCLDFENEIRLEKSFDYIILFNVLPHLHDFDRVFSNAYNNLSAGGKLIMAHSKTREGLKEHHRKIGYQSEREPIPDDMILTDICNKYKFQDIQIQDMGYFYFYCKK